MNMEYEIVETLGVLSQKNDGRFTKEVNIVRWGDHEPVLDIRKWDRTGDRPMRGITLTQKEADELSVILDKM